MRPGDHRGSHDPRHQHSGRAKPDVRAARSDDHRGAGEDVGEHEQRQLEGVTAEDVAHRELMVAEPHGFDAARELRERCRQGEDGRAEDSTLEAHPVGEDVPRRLERRRRQRA